MITKRNLLLALLFVMVAGSGYFVRTQCLRFPTEAEMRDYYRKHSSSAVESVVVENLVKKSTGNDVRVFKITHSPGGQKEYVYIETTRRWVLPWNQYRWRIDKVK